MSGDEAKRAAAAEAVGRVESGMRLGLGTGSTVAHFLELLGERIDRGELTDIRGVATSVQTSDRAHAHRIPLDGLPQLAPLDLTIDGADEIAPGLDLVKGLGGALLREKIVAEASRRVLIIADDSKMVERLGERAPLPVEIVSFGWQIHLRFFEDLGARPVLRVHEDDTPVPTDNGNYVVDCHFGGGLPDPPALDEALTRHTGVVTSGLFLGIATEAVVAGADGVRTLSRDGERTGRPGGGW